jgi:deoxyribodipyrimidine photo-lyase
MNLVDDNSFAAALAGCFLGDAKPGPLRGGRTAALHAFNSYDPTEYGKTRNFLDAPVSRLSPYLRHGMLGTVEVRDAIRQRFQHEPQIVEEFLRQLAWRDFFEKVLDYYGRGLDEDLEEGKHGVQRVNLLPGDAATASTGLPCMDGILHDLFDTGYLHNHARLWFAAYWCHFRGLDWKAGAKLFRQYLYDGDIASNSSSWQWVESTFASKPYFMNKDNIDRFSRGRWCSDCTAKCPFDADYDTLQRRLFGGNVAPLKPGSASETPRPAIMNHTVDVSRSSSVVWIHDAAISATDPALLAAADAMPVFVFDQPALHREPWAFHRLAFLRDGLLDLFAVRPGFATVGDPVEVLKATHAKVVHVSDHPNPWVRETIAALQEIAEVVVHPRPVLAEYAEEPRRFSRYWDRVAPQILGYRPKSGKKMR